MNPPVSGHPNNLSISDISPLPLNGAGNIRILKFYPATQNVAIVLHE